MGLAKISFCMANYVTASAADYKTMLLSKLCRGDNNYIPLYSLPE